MRRAPDADLIAVFTRREPSKVAALYPETRIVGAGEVEKYKDDIDVMIMCGGSASDLPVQTPALARLFNVVDSFDAHARIAEHFRNVDAAARPAGKTAIISAGWDPGLFSLNRLYADAVLRDGKTYSFWGRGVSQGHSDAVRRIEGVADARQYTVPVPESLEAVRNGENPELTPRTSHTRECYVVAKPGADKEKIEREIKAMPLYFADYDVTVNFISQKELDEKHAKLPHRGFVVRSGFTGEGNQNKQIIEYSLKLDSNPEFTGGVLAAFARAAYRLNCEGLTGCKTVLDVPPAKLSPKTGDGLFEFLL